MATVNLTETTFEPTVKKDGIVLVDWWADWCGPCKRFAPTYEAVSEKYPDVTFGKVNTEENRGLAGGFQIRSIPTLMIFRDGIMVFNQPGMVPQSALEKVIEQAQALDMDEVRQEVEKAKAQASAATA